MTPEEAIGYCEKMAKVDDENGLYHGITGGGDGLREVAQVIRDLTKPKESKLVTNSASGCPDCGCNNCQCGG